MFENLPPDVTQGAAGFIGSAVGLKWSPGNLLQRLGNFAIGGAIAVFLGPWLAEWFTVESPAGKVAVSFSIGMCGIFVLSKIIESIQAIDSKEIGEAVVGRIKRFFGGSTP